jgi:hypothetical protein
VKNPLNKALSLELNVARVMEIDSPTDCAPVEWRFATTEIVDHVRPDGANSYKSPPHHHCGGP